MTEEYIPLTGIKLEEYVPLTDIELARKKLQDAADMFVAIAELPKEIGAKVQWEYGSPGVIWTRTGTDAWQPNIEFPEKIREIDRIWPSSHVAMYRWHAA